MSSDVDREPLAERLLLLGTRTGLVLLLAMPLVVTEETFFPFVVGKSVFGRSVIEAVFAMWLIAAILYPRHRLPRSWLLVAFGVYVIVNFASGIAGVSLQRSLWSTYERMQGTVDLVHWMMLAVVLAAAFRSISDWTFLFGVNVMVSLLVALLGVAEHLDVNVPLFESISRGEGDRVSITLGNPTYVGAYMIVNALIGLALLAYSFNREPAREVSGAVRRRRRRDAATSGYVSWPAALRVVLVACIALDLWIVTLTGTRGATLGLAAGLIAFAVAYLAVGNVRAVKYAAAAVLAVVAVLALALGPGRGTPPVERLSESNVLVARLSSIGPDDGSIRSRLESVAIGLKAFAARPILGWGPENYIVPWGRYLEEDDRKAKRFDHAHNKIIEETTTKGALGLVSYLSLWAIMLAVLYRRARTENAHLQLLVLLAGSALAAYFVQNLALFDTPATVLQFMLLFGFVVSLEVTGTGRTSKDEAGDGHKPRHSHGLVDGACPPSGLTGGLGVGLDGYDDHEAPGQPPVGGASRHCRCRVGARCLRLLCELQGLRWRPHGEPGDQTGRGVDREVGQVQRVHRRLSAAGELRQGADVDHTRRGVGASDGRREASSAGRNGADGCPRAGSRAAELAD